MARQQPSSNSLPPSPSAPQARRSHAGHIQLTDRDGDGLTVLAEMYGAPYDLLATRLDVDQTRLRGILTRWRKAGLAETGRLAAGPSWAWLTPAGMAQVGYPWDAGAPPISRLSHTRAVLATRMWMERSPQWETSRAYWICERQLRAGEPATGRRAHVADAEVWWPAADSAPEETWAVECELTPKGAARTAEIIAGLLAGQKYARVMYLCSPSTMTLVQKTAGRFPAGQAERVSVQPLPSDALPPGGAR